MSVPSRNSNNLLRNTKRSITFKSQHLLVWYQKYSVKGLPQRKTSKYQKFLIVRKGTLKLKLKKNPKISILESGNRLGKLLYPNEFMMKKKSIRLCLAEMELMVLAQ